jgi:hypothetical protein
MYWQVENDIKKIHLTETQRHGEVATRENASVPLPSSLCLSGSVRFNLCFR